MTSLRWSWMAKFQSTPPVAGRRCKPVQTSAPAAKEFQSTPPVAGRRCSLRSADVNRKSSFNPRLPLPGGDAHAGKNGADGAAVSIHASRCREAMQGSPLVVRMTKAFQSTPPVAGRRCLRWRWCPGAVARFNPRLPLPGGDARKSMTLCWHSSSFNPRLPLPGGDAAGPVTVMVPLDCFNPRLPLPGGDASA